MRPDTVQRAKKVMPSGGEGHRPHPQIHRSLCVVCVCVCLQAAEEARQTAADRRRRQAEIDRRAKLEEKVRKPHNPGILGGCGWMV